MATRSQAIWRSARIVLACLIIILVNFTVQVGSGPSITSMSTDSAVFAYCGQQILAGRLLYLDCWDNKPPGVYYLNAAAIYLGGSNPGSVWAFQVAWMAASGVAFYLVMRKIWGEWPGLAAAGLFLTTALSSGYYQGGNFTESYVLLVVILQMGALYGYLSSEKRAYLALLGFLAALAFLLKPTYIAMSAATGLVALYSLAYQRDMRRMLEAAGLILAGLAAPLLLVGYYWLAHGAWGDLWFAVFTHNFRYTREGFSLRSLYGTARLFLVTQPLASLVALAGMGLADFFTRQGRQLFKTYRDKEESGTFPTVTMEETQARWMVALAIAIPIDMFLVALPGKNFGHYFLVPLPALAAGSAYLFHRLMADRRERQGRITGRATAGAAVAFLLAAWLLAVLPDLAPDPARLAGFLQQPDVRQYQYTQDELYILDHSQPSQTLLAWTSDPYLNFITGRPSPTRYVFPLHLLTPTPSGNHGFGELLQELQRDPPVLIMRQLNPSSQLPSFEDEVTALCPGCTLEARQGLLELKRFVEEHYRLDAEIGEWRAFRRVD